MFEKDWMGYGVVVLFTGRFMIAAISSFIFYV